MAMRRHRSGEPRRMPSVFISSQPDHARGADPIVAVVDAAVSCRATIPQQMNARKPTNPTPPEGVNTERASGALTSGKHAQRTQTAFSRHCRVLFTLLHPLLVFLV